MCVSVTILLFLHCLMFSAVKRDGLTVLVAFQQYLFLRSVTQQCGFRLPADRLEQRAAAAVGRLCGAVHTRGAEIGFSVLPIPLAASNILPLYRPLLPTSSKSGITTE